jgi:hypothetical protein
MPNDLDRLLVKLAAAEPPLAEGLESTVLAGIARRRVDMRNGKALAPFRVASVGVALAMGVTAGGIAAAATVGPPRPLSPFTGDAHLAPSTLLVGQG